MSTSSAKPKRPIHYPDSDGKPMGETGIHVNATIELFMALKWLVFGHRLDVYIAADMFFYYEEGNPRAVKAPDIMVIKGVSHPEERRSFKLWLENRVPSVIFEVTSKESRKDDMIVKMDLYARLGVLEYFLFDPLGEYLDPQFQAYRLENGRYVPIPPEADGDVISPELGLGLRVEGRRVRLINPADGEMIPDPNEAPQLFFNAIGLRARLIEERQARSKLEEKAREDARKVDSLEAEVKRLRALLGEE